jgi:hypothetical protein
MTPLEAWAALPLALGLGAFVLKAVLWATKPRRTLLDEHYEELEK